MTHTHDTAPATLHGRDLRPGDVISRSYMPNERLIVTHEPDSIGRGMLDVRVLDERHEATSITIGADYVLDHHGYEPIDGHMPPMRCTCRQAFDGEREPTADGYVEHHAGRLCMAFTDRRQAGL